MSDSPLYLVYKENIANLIKQKYPRIAQLSETTKKMIIEQLFWVQENTQFTPQADEIYQNGGIWQKHLHREIFRALSRIECMLLLHNINDENINSLYAEFVADQPANDRLTRDSFKVLSQLVAMLDDTQIDAQIRASLIASVTLSPRAKSMANERLGEGNYPYDSVMFSGRTIRLCGEIYPAYLSENEMVKKALWACFPDDNRHWRHAFFLENSGCLDALRMQVEGCKWENKTALGKEISEWLNYWLINALGFNGHIGNLEGSSFMTESVFQRTSMLNQSIERLLNEPELNVFEEYSNACLNFLKVTVNNPTIALLIVRTLNMANLFNRGDAETLEKYIRENQLLTMAEQHAGVFHSGKVATYLPGFLQNIAENGRSAMLLAAVNWASNAIERSDAEIVSFRLMDKKAIQQLIESKFNPDLFQINDKGEIGFSYVAALGPSFGHG